MNTNEELRAAYALNLCTVSISQIIAYDDVYVLEQEKDNILNNLNLEKMPKDDALRDVITKILEEIKFFQMDAGDKKMLERKYQHQVKNAIWSAVPNVGAIFATDNPLAMGVTLASQIGIGYMNYRRNRAEYDLAYDESKWKIQRNRMEHLSGLQTELFTTAWNLAKTYEFSDEYRLTEKQIKEYNDALKEPELVRRYLKLDHMKNQFDAYPAFWYQIGSTANSIYRSNLFEGKTDSREYYKANAIECFKKYEELNKFNMLRHDVLTASWALEYLELQDLNSTNNPTEAKKLIKIAESYSGDALDILELCAFEYLRIRDDDNAIRLFLQLVNEKYNSIINTQILSGLYINRMRHSDPQVARSAKIGYDQLHHITDPKYILEIPAENVDLSQWKPEWNQEESFEEFVDKQKKEQHQKEVMREEAIKKAQIFYQNPILLVYKKDNAEVAEYFLGVLNENRKKIGSTLPYPSQCELTEYVSKRDEFERKGTHVIMLGDSDEAKKIYKNVMNRHWDYDRLGMRFVSYGNKTVLLTRTLQNKQINDLVLIAREIGQKHKITIPSDTETVSYTFLRDCFNSTDFSDPVDGVASVISAIVGFPLLVLGQVVENIGNGIQFAQNLAAKKKLDFLQYCVAIYKYLDSENAIVD